jgi:hypothetical protein
LDAWTDAHTFLHLFSNLLKSKRGRSWYSFAIMLKRLAMAGLLAIGVLGCTQEPLPVKGSEQQKQSQPCANEAQPNTPTASSPEVAKENAENAERYAYYKSHPKEYLKAAIAPANLSNWILAGLGAVGGVLAMLTLLFIKRQVDIAEFKDRALLSIQLGEDEFWTSNDPDKPGEEYWQVGFTIRNLGPTRATFVRFEVFAYKHRNKKPLQETPAFYLHVPELIEGNSSTDELAIALPTESLDEVFGGDITTGIRGCIYYRDIFERRRKTCFGYIWQTYKRSGKRLPKDFRWEKTSEKQNRAS